jgi:hypothetical protein
MLPWRGRLMIGGGLDQDGNLAAWEGNVLEIIAEVSPVHAATVWRDTLILGTHPCGDVQCHNWTRLFTWDCDELSDFAGWSDLLPEYCPPIIHISVPSLLATDQGVIVTGILPEFSDPSIERVALWTGHEWKPMGSLTGYGALLVQADTPLLAAVPEGHQDPNHVLRWDGEGWVPFGSVLDGAIEDLVVHEGDLIAGGRFTGSVARISRTTSPGNNVSVYQEHHEELEVRNARKGQLRR